MIENRQPRLRAANLVISTLAGHGPRFLYSPSDDRPGRLGLDRYGQTWYVDGFTGLMLYPFPGHAWKGFSAGPVLQEIVQALALYVRNGDPVDLALLDAACAEAYGDWWPALRAELENNNAITKETNEHTIRTKQAPQSARGAAGDGSAGEPAAAGNDPAAAAPGKPARARKNPARTGRAAAAKTE